MLLAIAGNSRNSIFLGFDCLDSLTCTKPLELRRRIRPDAVLMESFVHSADI
jgi:hypothetical protein